MHLSPTPRKKSWLPFVRFLGYLLREVMWRVDMEQVYLYLMYMPFNVDNLTLTFSPIWNWTDLYLLGKVQTLSQGGEHTS